MLSGSTLPRIMACSVALEQVHYFGVDLAVTLEDTKDNRFAVGTATAFSLNASRAKERFINFKLPG